MKKAIYLLLFLLAISGLQIQAQDPKITIEKVAEKCQGLPRAQRVTVKVVRFSVSTPKAQGQFGDELATMLTAAIQQTNCFRVVESNKNMRDMTDEMNLDQSGLTDGSGPEVGKLLGAQLVVSGEVTEYAEGNSSTSFAGINVGANKAKVGFILKVLHPQTGEIIFSKSINMEGKSSGFTGVKLFGLQTAGSVVNKAVADACEKAIIKAVEILADEKDKMEIPEPVKPVEIKRFNSSNCTMLRGGNAPKVMILIKEGQTAGANFSRETDQRSQAELERQERQENREMLKSIFGGRRNQAQQPAAQTNVVTKQVVIEQSAAETEMIRKFVEAGFRVVDPKAYDRMRKSADSLDEDSKIAAVGLKLGANIIITGVAVSERINQTNGLISCRARIELRAITTDDATILASNAMSGGGADAAESIAAKVAMRNASDKMCAYMLEQLCSRNISFTGSAGGGTSKPMVATKTNNNTEIVVSNVSFTKLKIITDLLAKNPKVKEVQKSLRGTEASVQVVHAGNTDELVDMLTKSPSAPFEVTGLEEGRVTIKMN